MVIYRPVCKIQVVAKLMTLKPLSILYFYLCLDFKAFDTIFCNVSPESVNYTLWSVNHLSDRCRIYEACWSVFMLCFIPFVRFQPKSQSKFLFLLSISSLSLSQSVHIEQWCQKSNFSVFTYTIITPSKKIHFAQNFPTLIMMPLAIL